MRKAAGVDAAVLRALPAAKEEQAKQCLQQEVRKNHRVIIVLDDDPTGVQTVHDVSVYTGWDEESMRAGFAEEQGLFYILTNSRGLTADRTVEIHETIAHTAAGISRETGKDFLIISRSDSTLRGHYPLETETLRRVLETETGIAVDGEVLCPFFKEGGRFTIDNIHYVKEGDVLVPAGETEFAKDRTFGYHSSDLTEYIEEKTKGVYRAEDVTSITLEDLRNMNLEKITAQLLSVENFHKIIVNAADYADIKVFCTALYRAMEQGKRFLFRTAAGFVKEMGGISSQPLLARNQMITKKTEYGGVIVVGSHTGKTTRQLEEVKKIPGIQAIPFDSDLVLDEEAFAQETLRVTREIEETIRAGKTAVAYTKRDLLCVPDDTRESALLRSVKISQAVQSLVGNLTLEPAFVIAKGGITSSDVGTKALRVKKARVMGQIRPGIPVWQTGEESRFPHIPYVIFPGNVGEDSTLREAAEILMG